VVIDAIRCARLGLDRGLAGTLVAPAAYFMKSPPLQYHDDVAREMVEDFIAGRDDSVLNGTEAAPAAKSRRRPRARASAASR
jgi:myo-inositol-1-phosphate synthase